MAFQKGHKKIGGKQKGTIQKPRISDYLTKSQVDTLVLKAYEMAENGNETMLKFVLEQNFGKAPQAMEVSGKDGQSLVITFDEAFKQRYEEK